MSLVPAQNFSKDEIAHLREAGKILASLFRDVRQVVRAGASGREINDWFAREIKTRGAHATYLDKDVNFPGVICISPNDTVVHGVPNDEPFAAGDIVSFDLVIDVAGMKADSAFTVIVDEEMAKKAGIGLGSRKLLLNTTKQSLYAGIDAAQISLDKNGLVNTADIAVAVEKVLDKQKLGVVRDLVGHGIGRSMHEDPDVPNFAIRGGNRVPRGNAIAIEPMATLGGWKVAQDADDGWTIRTRDGSLAAHFEHTILLGDAKTNDNTIEIITDGGF